MNKESDVDDGVATPGVRCVHTIRWSFPSRDQTTWIPSPAASERASKLGTLEITCRAEARGSPSFQKGGMAKNLQIVATCRVVKLDPVFWAIMRRLDSLLDVVEAVYCRY